MITISLCMIVKNEENVLRRCLESVTEAVDEIIIIDTGSTDKTKEIATTFTDKVYDFEWINDFSAARNFAFSKATMDYQMWLDADDIIDPIELEKFKALKKTLDPSIDIVTFKYHTHFDADGNPTLTSTRERLFKREKNFEWQDAIHEYVPMSGNIIHEKITISHKKIGSSGDRNLKIYRHLIASGKELSPRETYYFARELMDHGIFEESIQYFKKFLDSKLGWFEDNIATCFNLSRCYEALNQRDEILSSLFKSFEYDTPRAEICCQIAYYYKNIKDFKRAIYWFELALTLIKDSIGFILNDYWDFIPAIELCVCYSQIGNMEKSLHYHYLSKQHKPLAPGVIYNEEYFKSIKMIKEVQDAHLPNLDEFLELVPFDGSKKVLVGSPVHQKPRILKEFLYGLSKLSPKGLQIYYLFIDDNEDMQSSKLLTDFQDAHDNVMIWKNVEEQVFNAKPHQWRDEVILKVGKNKDKILDFARKHQFDFVFLADSDLVLHPETLTHLVSLEKDVVSEVFYTAWTEGSMEMPQVWLYDTYDFVKDKNISEEQKSETFFKFMEMLRKPGVYQVGGLGACTMISKIALEKDVSFAPIYNLSFWGEDRHFCIRAAALGIQLHASTYYPPFHIYRDCDLVKVADFWQNVEAGEVDEKD